MTHVPSLIVFLLFLGSGVGAKDLFIASESTIWRLRQALDGTRE